MAQTSVSTPPAMVPAQTGEKTGDKRKPIRRDPQKRRQQNLQAQKKYRDKLRKRLDDLEVLAASVAKSRETPEEATHLKAATLPTTPISDGITTPDVTPDGTLEDWSLPKPPKPPLVALSLLPTPQEWDLAASPCAATEDLTAHLPLWDCSTSIDPSYLTVANHGRSSQKKEKWYKAYVDCGCPTRHVEIRTKGPGISNTVQVISVGDSMLCLRTNHLRVETLCIISAMWANCQQVGYSPDAFCSEDSVSAFYRPGACLEFYPGDNEGSNSVVSTVQRIYKTLRPDLRPTKEQIMVPHDTFIDIFPFPTLRRNILLSSECLDEDEFCFDLLNGLICWGGAGLGKRDRSGGGGAGGRVPHTATPWDSRSWEAKPWFLRKYWRLLGGEEGELARQSEWWRNMRGEEDDIWAGPCEQPPAESLTFSSAKACDAGFLGLLGE